MAAQGIAQGSPSLRKTGMPAQHSFNAFPTDDRMWEVVMYGALQPSAMGQGISVLLADADWRRSRARPDVRRLMRPLGDIAGLPLGSRWVNGVSQADHVAVQTVTIEVPPITGWPDHKLGEPGYDDSSRMVYPAIGLGEAPVWRIPVGRYSYFVPAIELVRATFGSTSDMLRLAIEGGVELSLHKRRVTISLDSSGRDLTDPRVVHIKANQALHRREAETIARILTNTRMRKSFVQIFASVQEAQVYGRPSFPRTIFPFDHPTTWTVDTAWTTVNGASRRCLITRIRSIRPAIVDFEKVIVEVPRSIGEPDDDERPRPVRMAHPQHSENGMRIDPHRIPVRGISPVQLMGGQTSYEPGFSLEHVVAEVGASETTVPFPDRDEDPLEMGSTWHGAGRKGGAVGVSFKSSPIDYPDTAREADAVLMSTRRAAERLAARKQWPCQLVSPVDGCGSDAVDGLFRYPPQYSGRRLGWSEMKSGSLRRALIIRLAPDQANVYLIDAEREGASEGHALGLVLTSPNDLLDHEDLQDILAVNASNRGVWGVETLGRATAKRKRNARWYTSTQAYSIGLLESVMELITRVSPGRV